MNWKRAYIRFHAWRYKRISEKNFILLVSLVLGFLSGTIAVGLKFSVTLLQQVTEHLLSSVSWDWYNLVFPAFGILATLLLITLIFRGKYPTGIPEILVSLTKKNPKLQKNAGISSYLGAVFTVGMGGSVGLEAPAAQSASVFSRNISKLLHLNFKTRTLLIGCAATATLAAIFNAPIAAVVFALEVFMLDLTTASIIPLLLSSVSAVLATHLLGAEHISFSWNHAVQFEIRHLPAMVFLGVGAGLCSAAFHKLFFGVQSFFSSWSTQKKFWVGGISLGLLIFLFPALFGEGFSTINQMLSEEEIRLSFLQIAEDTPVFLALLVGIIGFKMMACSLTIQAGGVGGIFAPSLFVGGTFGYLVAKLLERLQIPVHAGQFTLLGMAGLIAGMLHAPLTAIFLIAETTGGYALFLPLMIVVSLAFVINRYFCKHSIYTESIEQQGEHVSHDKDKVVVQSIRMEQILEKNFMQVPLDGCLQDLVECIKKSSRNIFVVIDEQEQFMGIIQLDDVREIMFSPEIYRDTTIRELVHAPQGLVQHSDDIASIVEIFRLSDAWNVVVLDNGKFAGIISRSRLFHVYRKALQSFTNE